MPTPNYDGLRAFNDLSTAFFKGRKLFNIALAFRLAGCIGSRRVALDIRRIDNCRISAICGIVILSMKAIVVLVLVGCVVGLPSNASYTRADGRPLNIAHRGLSSLFPENTLESFAGALYQGADFIELDIVYTKEKLPLVMHDPYLTRITNIRNLTQFQTRYSTRTYNGGQKTDWWTDEFTLAELQTIKIKQALVTGRLNMFDYLWTFPTLDDVIKLVVNFNVQHKGSRNPDHRLAGILIEAKDSQMYRDMYGLEIGETILRTLEKYGLHTVENATKFCPIYLHSFDYGTVKYWAANSPLPRNFLLFHGSDFNLTDINKYATGIGFQDSIIWNYDAA